MDLNEPYDRIDTLIEHIQEKPKDVLKKIKKPYLRWMVFAVIIFSFLLANGALTYYCNKLQSTVYHFDRSKWFSHAQVTNRATLTFFLLIP
jgi:hypothetical protein